VIIQLVPRVCSQLSDQSNCAKAIEACGANTDPVLCTAKLIGKGVANPEPMIVIKALSGFGKDVYHGTMQVGHDYLHAVADRTMWWWINDCCKAAVGG
jgi:hypothetical protein